MVRGTPFRDGSDSRRSYRLPFETYVLDRFTRNQVHRDRQGFTWTEPMTLEARCLAVRLDAISLPNNDNKQREDHA